MSPHYTRSGRTIHHSTSLPPSPPSEATGIPLGEGATEIPDVCATQSAVVPGLVPGHNALPASSGTSGDESAATTLALKDQITGPNKFESPHRTSRAVVLHTVFTDRLANTNILFQDWFADQPDENEIKQEEQSYDWAGSKDDDPLPDISDMSDRLATGLREARKENDIQSYTGQCNTIFSGRESELMQLNTITFCGCIEGENHLQCLIVGTAFTCYTDPSKTVLKKAKREWKLQKTPLTAKNNDGRTDSPDRIHFRDKGKWLATDRDHRPPLGEASGTRAWVSEEQEETLSVRRAQLEYDQELARELQARNDSDYEAESRHLDNQMSYNNQLPKARRKRTSAHALSASARIYSRNEHAGPDECRPSKHAKREGPMDEEQSRDRKNWKLERYRKKIERANLKSTRKAERQFLPFRQNPCPYMGFLSRQTKVVHSLFGVFDSS
ncbi:hypothetical protein FIBSPDRAFT_887983 [Athelia psychrophila]|uniref:Uncharacterized protein n=1 Tax=Athelia psychrophila TaxID=1759441 RepID=A0A166NWU1_9AGAM|nr:hypothetical protein FIBSPDRAFT_887983 [Fibularhizoctonia sp. CBS 109695]